MIETLVLVLLSMLAGGAVVQHDGMKGLGIMIAGILLVIIFYGGLPGVILGAFGLLVLMILWFNSEKDKPISSLYIRSQKKDKMQHEKPIDRSWVKKELERGNANLAKKYPVQFEHLVKKK